MLIFEKVSAKNFMSIGNTPVEIDLNSHGTTLITAKNGAGKCLCPTTEIEISINDEKINEIFLEFMKNR